MVLWSLASLELYPPPRGWVSRLVARLPPHRLGAFQPQALSNSTWALARLGVRPGAGWLAALVDACGRKMQVRTGGEGWWERWRVFWCGRGFGGQRRPEAS
jgi:hypothetical protein